MGTSPKIRFQTLKTPQELGKTKVIIVMSYIQFFTSFQMIEFIFLIDEFEISTILTI